MTDVYYDRSFSRRPTVILCHVSAANKENLADKAESFLAMGYVAVAMDFSSTDDLKSLIRWVKQNAAGFGGDGRSLCIWGYSWGGDMAFKASLMFAGTPEEVQAAIIVAGAKTSHLKLLKSTAPPTLFVHSQDDKTVPFKGSQVMSEALEKKRIMVERLYYKTGGHKPHKENPQEFENKMQAFLVKKFGRVLALADTAAAGEDAGEALVSMGNTAELRSEETIKLRSGIVTKNIRYSGSKMTDVYYDRSFSRRPTVILCHVSAANKENLADKAESFLAMGYVAVAMDFSSTDDLKSLIRWVKQNAAGFGGDGRSLCIWGYSWGGDMAFKASLMFAGTPEEVQAAIIVAGAKTSHLKLLKSTAPPTLFVHSQDDKTVPFKGSQVMSEALEKKRIMVERLYYKTGGHKPHKENPQEFENKMQAFLVKKFGRVLALADTAAADANATAA